MSFGPLVTGLLEMLAPRHCAGCAIVLDGDEETFCGGCQVLLERTRDSDGVFVHGGPVRDALHALKYGRRSELAKGLGSLWAAALGGIAPVDVVVPVPLHPARLRARTFNPVALLAAPVARGLGVPLDPRRLRRIRPTPPQVELPRSARLVNVRGAFVARPDPRRPRVLLLDDVRTTGATLSAAAEALRRGGATEVIPMAFAVADVDGMHSSREVLLLDRDACDGSRRRGSRS